VRGGGALSYLEANDPEPSMARGDCLDRGGNSATWHPACNDFGLLIERKNERLVIHFFEGANFKENCHEYASTNLAA
jgi:hypothetical protein